MSILTKILRRGYRSADAAVHARLYAGKALRRRGDWPRSGIADLAQQSVLVVVAHPDDEVIGIGAVLSRVREFGIVTVTDGAPRDGRAARKAGFDSIRSYGEARRREAAAALALLGRAPKLAENLGYSDQRAIANIVPIVRRLMALMRANGFKYVVTHPYEGGHPDHDATALSVHAACILLRESGFEAPIPVEMTSYHLADGMMVRGRFLPQPGTGPVESFVLDAPEQDLKRRMFACHQSQRAVLDEFPLDAERFRAAPPYDFLTPPHAGPLAYEVFMWNGDGAAWRRSAARALRRLGLLDPA